MKGKYPLDALTKLRHRVVDERVREVADRVRRAEQALEAVKGARRAREAEQARSRTVAVGEQGRLETGDARAGDLRRQAEWALGAAERAVALEQRESRADNAVRAARHAEEQARGQLASADADAKAVDEHAARWQKERDRKLEADEEEQAGEAFVARSLQRGGG